MTTISSIAQRILDENGYTLADDFQNLTLTILEYKIDDAIDYVNLMADTSIAALSGTAETKSFVYTAGENIPVKHLVNLMLQAYKDKGTVIGLGAMNISYVQANPDYALSWELINKSLERLKQDVSSDAPPIWVSEDPVPT